MRNTFITLALSILFNTSLYAQSIIVDPSEMFFPTEMLVEKQLYDYWHNDTLFLSLFAQALGHSPNSCEIDSMLNIQLQNTAIKKNILYSSELIKLEEPVICYGYPKNVYRFTWFHNELKYDYNPYSIRIEEDDIDNHIVIYSYCYWGKNICNYDCDTLALNEEQWSDFIKLINDFNFWEKPSTLDTLVAVFGGSTYILESYVDNRYHVIFRETALDSSIDNLQKYLWKLTGLKKNKSKKKSCKLF